MENTVITIGIMTYDRVEMLKEAINSVLNQSYEKFKLIIANDFIESPISYETLGIKKDPRIELINHSVNKGEVKNMNFLLHYADTEWFTWLADDDVIHPDYLKKLHDAIIQNNDVVAAYSNFADGPSPEGVYPPKLTSEKSNIYNPKEFISEYTLKKCSLIGCYGLMKTEYLKVIGGISLLGNGFGPYSDTLIPIKLAKYGSIIWVDEPLVFLRTHPESPSHESADFLAFTSAETDFLKGLKEVSSGKNLIEIKDESIFNMMVWFSKNQLCVLSRDNTLNIFMKLKKYLKQQLSFNEKQVISKYKIKYYYIILLHLFRFIVSNTINKSFYRLKVK